ncbi:hypothetical protein [Alicyclobacillus sp.]|uniref:hypothetical protein n=1 Tax=Alicyclobacillus sp. TaxID=61169 RepID=UPI0025C4AB21|nr:hypothetical protein [Alicyclobacillus sp.]MCL6516838.1 hypothetical protein [Alicyclobacillus sp.]
MSTRFRPRTRVRSLRGTVLVAVLAAAAVFELVRLLLPLTSANPLYHEVTIGEPVIGEWKYGGLDEEGYLKFYNGGQTVLLPPNERLFDADGRFVVIEGHTPSSLTYARPVAAIPLSWLAAGAGVLAIPAALLWMRLRRRRRRMRVRAVRPGLRRAGPGWRAEGRRASGWSGARPRLRRIGRSRWSRRR